LDVSSAIDFVKQKYDWSKVVVIGTSQGGATSIIAVEISNHANRNKQNKQIKQNKHA